MSRLCRLKTASHGDDGKWAYAEIIKLKQAIDSQAADIAALQETLEAERERRFEGNRISSEEHAAEIEQYKSLCDQMGIAISKCRFDSLNMSAQDMVQASGAFAAWRAMK